MLCFPLNSEKSVHWNLEQGLKCTCFMLICTSTQSKHAGRNNFLHDLNSEKFAHEIKAKVIHFNTDSFKCSHLISSSNNNRLMRTRANRAWQDRRIGQTLFSYRCQGPRHISHMGECQVNLARSYNEFGNIFQVVSPVCISLFHYCLCVWFS